MDVFDTLSGPLFATGREEFRDLSARRFFNE